MCSRLRSEIVIVLLSDTAAIVALFPMSASFAVDGPHLVGASLVAMPGSDAESPVAARGRDMSSPSPKLPAWRLASAMGAPRSWLARFLVLASPQEREK
jgi:hypothetical protein